MKNVVCLSMFLLLTLCGCDGKKSDAEGASETKEIISDNSELEEAMAISRKIYEGIEKVESGKLTKAEFQTYAKPLQRKLNSLIINMKEADLEELENYNYELMEELTSKAEQTQRNPSS